MLSDIQYRRLSLKLASVKVEKPVTATPIKGIMPGASIISLWFESEHIFYLDRFSEVPLK